MAEKRKVRKNVIQIRLPSPKRVNKILYGKPVKNEFGVTTKGDKQTYNQYFSEFDINPRQRAFLAAYVESCGQLQTALKAACVASYTYYSHWRKDPEFMKALQAAKDLAAEFLLDAATKRAAEGYEEPVFYRGKKIGTIPRYSDQLMALLLKGAFPEKFKERVDQRIGNMPGEGFRVDPGRERLPDEIIDRILEYAQKIEEERRLEKAALRSSPLQLSEGDVD
ncbi:MAG TPA: hypothetical protein PKY23_10960 [Bacillota bacterium]|nr:hypothetical protein [Bacillota bacterium]